MKQIENEIIQTLTGEINFLFGQVKEFDAKLRNNISHIAKHEHLVSAAYHLNCIYSCFEDIFAKIAKVFENRIENPASWHKELLERMRIEVPKVRPAVIDAEVFTFLDEMRGFRHVFRSSYVFNLDKERVLAVAKKWAKNRKTILKEISDFIKSI